MILKKFMKFNLANNSNATSANILPQCVIFTLLAMSPLLDAEGLEGLLGIAQATLIKQNKTRPKRLISLTS